MTVEHTARLGHGASGYDSRENIRRCPTAAALAASILRRTRSVCDRIVLGTPSGELQSNVRRDKSFSSRSARNPDAEPSGSFPDVPAGWFYLCQENDLKSAPVRAQLGRASYVCFRDASDRAVTLDARCSHMGADLSHGEVSKGRLRCPLHAWEYEGDGRCAHIPATNQIPPFACQTVYPTVELRGHVLFHSTPVPRFVFPFYDGCTPDELVPAEPFDFVVDTPWYMIGANAFDLQHFRVAHDRTLVGRSCATTSAGWPRQTDDGRSG
jgi:nitrite reductase/ring-hydroxylating ferredoxin subunit